MFITDLNDVLHNAKCIEDKISWILQLNKYYLPGRRSLRSADTSRLVLPPVRLSTIAYRAFPVVVTHTWNDLPSDVMPAESLSTFRQQLKTHLFSKSFPGYYLYFFTDLHGH